MNLFLMVKILLSPVHRMTKWIGDENIEIKVKNRSFKADNSRHIVQLSCDVTEQENNRIMHAPFH